MARKKEPDQLSKDSTAALEANMSYGKWKALQWEAMGRPVYVRPEPEQPEPNTVCKCCGNGFYNKFKNNKVYCSEECRRMAQNKLERERKWQRQESMA